MKIYTYNYNYPEILTKQFEFTNNKFDKEITIALQYDSLIPADIYTQLKIFGIPIIGFNRMSKLEQSMLLSKFNIKTPKTYFNEKRFETFKTIEQFDSYCYIEEFIVKPLYGARGVGVKKLNRKEYKELLGDVAIDVFSEIYAKEIKEQEKYAPDIDKDFVIQNFKEGTMLVQEYIEIEREFRLLCFTNEHLIYERKKQTGQIIGNLSHGSIPLGVDEKYYDRNIRPVVEKIRLIMEEFKYPWLSVDIYADKNGNIGVFEFQMEFAYEGFKPKDVRECMERSINGFKKI